MLLHSAILAVAAAPRPYCTSSRGCGQNLQPGSAGRSERNDRGPDHEQAEEHPGFPEDGRAGVLGLVGAGAILHRIIMTRIDPRTRRGLLRPGPLDAFAASRRLLLGRHGAPVPSVSPGPSWEYFVSFSLRRSRETGDILSGYMDKGCTNRGHTSQILYRYSTVRTTRESKMQRPTTLVHAAIRSPVTGHRSRAIARSGAIGHKTS